MRVAVHARPDRRHDQQRIQPNDVLRAECGVPRTCAVAWDAGEPTKANQDPDHPFPTFILHHQSTVDHHDRFIELLSEITRDNGLSRTIQHGLFALSPAQGQGECGQNTTGGSLTRLQCDETKPSCRRCYIYGKPCTGYTDQFQFRHGLSTSSFANTSPTSSADSPPLTIRDDSPAPRRPSYAKNKRDDPNAKAVVARQRSQYPTISPHLDLSDEHVSLCYFVRRFTSPDGTDSFPGHLTFLPDLFNHQGQGLLEVATLSVSQMAAFNQFGSDRFRMQAYRNYGRALGILQSSILSDEEVADDRLLAAVLLLCTFKDLSGEGSGDPSDHAAGLFYLLEKRGFEQLATRRGFELFILALLRLVRNPTCPENPLTRQNIYSFMHDDDRYNDPGGLTGFLALYDPLMRAMSMVAKTLMLRHTLAECRQSDGSGPNEAVLIEECFESLHEFATWDMEAASYWQNTFEGRTVPTTLGEVAFGSRYYDPETACTIILVRCSRLILILSMLEYRDRMIAMGDEEATAQWADCVPALIQDLRSTIDDMLSCVPYALGDLDPSGRPVSMGYDGAGALVILQPVRLVTYCRHTTPQQAQASQDILNRLNTTMGIRSAISWEEAYGSPWTQRQNMLREPCDQLPPLKSPITP